MSLRDKFASGKSIVVQIQAQLAWHCFYDVSKNRWLAVCPPLNLNAVGETWAELQEYANEATQLLFEDLLAHDELDSFLRRHGWAAVALHDSRPNLNLTRSARRMAE